eukprot:GFKZ01005360.1.p1 GENE.GFKZ01005360.1~~GFKZ01005360.1.p1  ORF type:complete len:134 (-),score=14.53 GFKZ01005360.1:4-405(-)
MLRSDPENPDTRSWASFSPPRCPLPFMQINIAPEDEIQIHAAAPVPPLPQHIWSLLSHPHSYVGQIFIVKGGAVIAKGEVETGVVVRKFSKGTGEGKEFDGGTKDPENPSSSGFRRGDFRKSYFTNDAKSFAR